MINPIRLTEDLFDDEKLFDDDLRAFVEDFLLRLVLPANNPGGIYNTMASDTSVLYNAFFGKMSNESITIAIREGLTIGKDNARIAVTEKLSSLQNLVSFKFGKDSGIYQEFYPQGMKEYHHSKQGDLKVLLERFVSAANTHLATDYPDEYLALTGLVATYKSNLDEKIFTVGKIDNLKTKRREDRKALTRKMSLNFLQLAMDHFENADAFDNYYNPSYLPLKASAKSEKKE
jgi:hypothetical protein